MRGIEALLGAGQVYALVTPDGRAKSELFTELRRRASSVTILRAPEGEPENKDPDGIKLRMVDSPLLVCLRQMVLGMAPWPYVFYAPPSSGKTSAARAFMQVSIPNLFPDLKERPKALMLTGAMELDTRRYFDHISSTFKSGKTPWFSSLIAALSLTKEEIESGKSASILILDDFDTEGDGNVNITNMKKFCHDLARLRDENEEQYEIFVVVITQSKEVANKLCKINNWQKIASTPGSYNPPTRAVHESSPLDPDWMGLPCTDDQLKKMVNKHFKAAELAGTFY